MPDSRWIPPKSGEEDDTRFALTSEAGLNDGLAFPFVMCAIALVETGGEGWVLRWLRVSRDREHGFQRIVSNDFRGS